MLPASPENIKENIKQKFLVEMPEDFYEFYEFCKVNMYLLKDNFLLKNQSFTL